MRSESIGGDGACFRRFRGYLRNGREGGRMVDVANHREWFLRIIRESLRRVPYATAVLVHLCIESANRLSDSQLNRTVPCTVTPC
jgi:hypothetical protein